MIELEAGWLGWRNGTSQVCIVLGLSRFSRGSQE